VPAHAETKEQRAARERISNEERADGHVGLVDDALGKRMVIAGNRMDGAVGKGEGLRLQRVGAADRIAVHGYKLYVIDIAVTILGKPSRNCRRVEHQVLVALAGLHSIVERPNRAFMLRSVRLN